MAFAAGLKLRGLRGPLLFRADARGRRGPDAKKKKYGRRGQKRTPQQDSSRVCRLISARRYGQATSLSRRARAAARAGDGERARTGEGSGRRTGALPLPSFWP